MKIKIEKVIPVLAVVCACYSTESTALSAIPSYPGITPDAVHVDQNNSFYLVAGRRILRLQDKFVVYAQLPEKVGRFTMGKYQVRVAGDGTVFAVATGTYSYQTQVKQGDKVVTVTHSESQLYQVQCHGSCNPRILNGSNLLEPSFQVSTQGEVFFQTYEVVKGTLDSNGDYQQKRNYYHYLNGNSVSGEEYDRRYGQAFAPELVSDGEDGFVFKGKAVKESQPHRLRGSRSMVWDHLHQPHLFFHDPGSRSLHHHYFNRADSKMVHLDIDIMESGVENAAFVDGEQIWVLHYYYRNNFNKGVAATLLDVDGRMAEQFVVDAAAEDNIGWDLHAARAPNGQILLTYQSDSQNKQHRYWLLDNAGELRTLAQRLSTYGTTTQAEGEASFEQQIAGQELANSLFKSYKFLALTFGTGVQYALWSYNFSDQLHYKVDNSFVNILDVGGQVRGFNFGMEYAKYLVDVGAPDTGASRLSSFASWNRLLFDFDFKLSLEKSTTQVELTDDKVAANDRVYTQQYNAVNLNLLTPRQRAFGLRYQKYNQYKVIHKQEIKAGSDQWHTVASGVGELEVNTLAAHFGYSTIDYLLKFETRSSQYFIDYNGQLGLVWQSYLGKDYSAWGGDRPKGLFNPIVGGNIEFGRLWYRRWNTRVNVGGLVKVSYRLDAHFYLDGEKESQEEKADKDDTDFVTNSGIALRHGPVAYVALVF